MNSIDVCVKIFSQDVRPLKPLPFQASATVSVNGTAEFDGKPILDKRPKSEKEEAIQKAKRIVKLMQHVKFLSESLLKRALLRFNSTF